MSVQTMPGSVAVVGIGPGRTDWCTPEVRSILDGASHWLGYGRYLEQAAAIVPPRRLQALCPSDNREEAARAQDALDLADAGARVAVISSGDPGVFAMAAAVAEHLDADPDRWAAIAVSVHPGVSAAQAAAARVGAPLGHDFCVLSLSDNLKPWSVIEARLDATAGVDLVLALYNPRSRHRPSQFGRAIEVIARHRQPATPVVVARDVGREAEKVSVCSLGELSSPAKQSPIDMRTIVIVGSSRTRRFDHAKQTFVYTPRHYPDG